VTCGERDPPARDDGPVDLALPGELEVVEADVVVAVLYGHDRAIRGDVEHHLRDDGRVVREARARVAVGRHEAVDDEVAVMDLLAEVAAVHDATVVALHEAVLGPLPHEAAGEAGIRLEEIPVLPHAAGARAHGVHELALDERQRRPPRVVARGTERRTAETLLADLPYLFVARVHARVDVGEAALPVALVVHEAARVEALRPQRHLVEVRARARL